MKLTCTQENFKKAIYSTERVIGKQATLPILENILLETEKGRLKISATNLEIGVFIKIGAKIEKEGRITIPANLLSGFVNNLPSNGNISLEVKNQNLNISSGTYKAKIKGLDAHDFPIIPELKSDPLFSISIQKLKKAIPKLLTSVFSDNSRPELSGINLNLFEKEIHLASTDSFRLTEIIIKPKIINKENFLILISKNNSLIIPANAFSEVLRAMEFEDGEVEIIIEENQIFFQIKNIRIVSRLINGKYPEYKQIIPEKFSSSFILKKDEFIRAVKLASVFTQSKSGEITIKTDLNNKKLSVHAESEEKGENKTEINILEGNGNDQEIIFNPRYVLDGINSIENEKIIFLFNNNSSPVAFKTLENDSNNLKGDFTHIIMPIKK